MTIAKKSFSLRAVSLVAALVLLLSGVFATTASAAGVETLTLGDNDIGSFTFTNTNTTPTKTIEGSKVKFTINWRVADGAQGIPDIDQGIGEAKLTVKVLDANTGTVIAGPYVFQRQSTDDSWFLTHDFTVNLGSPNRAIRLWFDASSVGASNGHYRSIHVSSFEAYVYN